MSDAKKHLENLTEIRSLMEQSSRFISLSGLGGILAGVFALCGAMAAYWYFDFNLFTPRFITSIVNHRGIPSEDFILFLLTDAGTVLILALLANIILTTRKAKLQGHGIWNNIVKRMLINLFIPLIAGGIFCIALMYHGLIYLVAPSTLVFFGLALLNAGKYTLRDIKYLGLCEIALGLVALFIPGYGLIFWSAGFGVLLIIYGIVMYMKYDRKKQ